MPSPERPILFDCPKCSARVSARVEGLLRPNRRSDDILVLAVCPSCGDGLFGRTYFIPGTDFVNDDAERLWPAPQAIAVSASVPEASQRDIKDAQKCIAHGIYSAAAVLCGRALERLVKDRAPDSKTLAQGLATLKATGIIDARLGEWADALRKERNIGAHASDEEVTKANAQDVLDFTVAIFEYVYVLTEKYSQFMARKQK